MLPYDLLPLGFILNIGWISGLCFILGFALVIFEMFNPGFGAPGITGGVLLLFGVILTAESVGQAIFGLILILLILGITLWIVLKSASSGRLSRTMVLQDSLDRKSGYSSTSDLSSLLGKEGIALTPLRPSGSAEFGSVRQDVVTQGEYIIKDSKVKVVRIEGRRIVVRKVETDN